MGRSWLLGSNKRSVIYAWPPLILIALIGTAMAESTMLYESGWMLTVICTVKASQGMSWRQALPAGPRFQATDPIEAFSCPLHGDDRNLGHGCRST
jgi:hypothetical protein